MANIGITGHQERPGIDWMWVAEAIYTALSNFPPPFTGFSSLAKGADQVFAKAVLSVNGELVFVRPTADYESHYEGSGLAEFKQLRDAASDEIDIEPRADDEDAFLAAGQRVASECDHLFAVWDGEGAAGRGGTADIVAFARERGTPIVHINPIARSVTWLS